MPFGKLFSPPVEVNRLKLRNFLEQSWERCYVSLESCIRSACAGDNIAQPVYHTAVNCPDSDVAEDIEPVDRGNVDAYVAVAPVDVKAVRIDRFIVNAKVGSGTAGSCIEPVGVTARINILELDDGPIVVGMPRDVQLI